MWSIPKAIVLFAAAASAIPLDTSISKSTGSDMSNLDDDGGLNDTMIDAHNLQARVPDGGRMTLQWSPQGRVLFLCGMLFPQAVIDGFAGQGPAGPARQMFNEFAQYVTSTARIGIQLLLHTEVKGGVYGKGGDTPDIEGTFGIGLQMFINPDAGDIQDLLEVFHAWASRHGGVVQVIQRANDFIDLARIGAGGSKRDVQLDARSRDTHCQKDMDLIQYATKDVPALDLNNEVRWGGSCPQ